MPTLKKTKVIDAILSKLEDVKIEMQDIKDAREKKYDLKSDKWKESGQRDGRI
jgi:hypothetical protein